MKKRVFIVALLLIVGFNILPFGLANNQIIVTRKKYQAENSTNLVLNKILSDNELKEEPPDMFNYAINRDDIIDGLYSNIDEDGTTYYYHGDVNNNNIVFGAYDEDYYIYGNDTIGYFQGKESCIEAGNLEDSCIVNKIASAGDKMYWKIIRMNGDGSLRLIYNGPGLDFEHFKLVSLTEKEIVGVIGNVPYNIESNDPKYIYGIYL